MLFSCRYNQSTGKLYTLVRGMELNAVTKDKMPQDEGVFGIIKRAPKELSQISIIEALRRVRVKHANSDKTVEVELTNA